MFKHLPSPIEKSHWFPADNSAADSTVQPTTSRHSTHVAQDNQSECAATARARRGSARAKPQRSLSYGPYLVRYHRGIVPAAIRYKHCQSLASTLSDWSMQWTPPPDWWMNLSRHDRRTPGRSKAAVNV